VLKTDKYTFFQKKKSLRFKGKLIELNRPAVMGIINLSPDSFYSGSVTVTKDRLLLQAEKMINEGADFLDLGAASTRPGAKNISSAEEQKRLIPAIKMIVNTFPAITLSVDTTSSETAEKAINEGAAMINDISAGIFDPRMFETIARYRIPIVLMHIQGTPQNMQKNPSYKNVLKEVIFFLSGQVEKAKLAGISDIIIDPGFGFGKTVEHNYSLLAGLDLFRIFECLVMVGISRKSMINKVLGTLPANALNGTTAVHTIALMNGADVLRVHDVKEAKQAIDIFMEYKRNNS
jgi:dihydropteroate synthase